MIENNDVNEYHLKIQKIVKIVKLYKKTQKNQRYSILSIVADIISKKDLRKNGFVFSNTMYNTAKRKRTEDHIEDSVIYRPESKKIKGNDVIDLINEYLTKYSEITCKFHRNKPIKSLQKSKLWIYKKMMNKNPEIKISISKYYKLVPKHFKYVKKRQTCVKYVSMGKKLKKSLEKTQAT